MASVTGKDGCRGISTISRSQCWHKQPTYQTTLDIQTKTMRHRGGFLSWLPPVKPEETQLVAPDTAAFWNLPGLTNRAQLLPRPGPPGKAVAGLIRSEPHPSGPQRSPRTASPTTGELSQKGSSNHFRFPKLVAQNHLFTSRRPTLLRSNICLANPLPPLPTEVRLSTPDTTPHNPDPTRGSPDGSLRRNRSPFGRESGPST